MAVGKKRKGTRFHSRWRVDQDYLKKLPRKEREWLQKFNDEYYRAEFVGQPLHAAGDLRRDIYRAQNTAERDLVTATSDDVVKALSTKISPRPSIRIRFYAPDDYRMFGQPTHATGLEQELVRALEYAEVEDLDIVDIFYALARRSG